MFVIFIFSIGYQPLSLFITNTKKIVNFIYSHLRFCNTRYTNKKSPRLLVSVLLSFFCIASKFADFRRIKEKRKRFYVSML